MARIAKFLSIATVVFAMSVATLAATTSAEAGPRGSGTRGLSGTDLGSGR
jgi:hypothetical protein